MEIDPHYRRQRLEAGWGPSLDDWAVSPEKCVELLAAMGWFIVLSKVGSLGAEAQPTEHTSVEFTATPLFLQLIFFLLGLFMGIVIKDVGADCIRVARKTVRRVVRRFLCGSRGRDEQIIHELRRAQARVNAFDHQLNGRRTQAQPTLRSSGSGRTTGRRAGYYVPPIVEITEDTTQAAAEIAAGIIAVVAPPLVEATARIAAVVAPPLVEATAFLELQHATPAQAAEVLDGLARYAMRPPRREASIVSESSDPWSLIAAQPEPVSAALLPIIEEPTADAEPYSEPIAPPVYVSGLLSHNIAPLGYCPQMMNSIGLLSRPPCTFVSQYGQRVHLYNDGRCLNNVNVRAGVRQLKALPVCLICTARWRAEGSPGSSNGRA
jgi:hypothetical protein